MEKRMVLVACLLAVASVAAAQQPPAPASLPAPSLVAEVQNSYNNIKGYITKSAAQFPEEKVLLAADTRRAVLGAAHCAHRR